MEKFSGINFNYTYRFYFLVVIRIHFDKNLFTPKYKQQESWSNKNHPQFTEYDKHQVLHEIQQQIHKSLLSHFLLHNFKLKTEGTIN